MFLDSLSKIGSSTISIPIGALQDTTGNIVTSLGVGIPSSAIPHLEKAGFSHSVAENISKTLFESSGKTLTGHWMDASGPFKSIYPEDVSVGWHRIHGHHFLTDGITTLKNPNLSFMDFSKHLATDVVTKNGLPLLPENVVREIATILSVSPTKVMPWVSMNILDIGASILAVGHSASNVTMVINGTAEWGLGYAANTFGVGLLNVGGGLVTHNPILIGAGAVDIACGSITAYDYYSQPFFCGVPVNDILSSSAIGMGVATLLAGVEIFVDRKNKTIGEQVPLLADRIGTSGLLAGMSAIAAPLSITTGFGITGFKLAKKASEDTNQYISAMPVTGGLSKEIDDFIFENYIEEEQRKRIMSYLD